jgi:hypothetical protein
MSSNDAMINGFEESGRGLIDVLSPRSSQELTQKKTKNLSQDSRCHDRDSNREPPKYESRELALYKRIWRLHDMNIKLKY